MQSIQGLRIAVAQLRRMPGDIRSVLKLMLDYIDVARGSGAQIVVFPELVIGYLLGDRWEYDEFIAEIKEFDEDVRRASADLVVIWGSVVSVGSAIGEDGRTRKYNAARIAQDGEWVRNGSFTGWIPKTNLPKYRIFDDARHFFPADKLASEVGLELSDILKPFPVTIEGITYRLGIGICEDFWEDEYLRKPSRIYAAHGVDLLIDISASPWTAGKWHARDRMLEKRVKDAQVPILYVNAVGLENNVKNLVWFDGDSALIGADGTFLWRGAQHREGLFMVKHGQMWERLTEIVEIHDAIIQAMRAYLGPFKKIVIGLSGGIDSAVEAALVVEALGAERVLALNMPTHFNSSTTQDLARECADNLGIEYRVIPIEPLYQAHLAMLAVAGYPNPKGITRENIQARIRGASVQAAVTQEENGAFLCNGNKTEMALNYFTLYGDGGGAAAFLADLWKGQIYALAAYMNAHVRRPYIPQEILIIVPSAELSADQNVDEGKGDPIYYPYHDRLLHAFTERRWGPTNVLRHAIAGDLDTELGCSSGIIELYFRSRAEFVANLEWAWAQYNKEFKRCQTPPIFLASRRAFGFDRRDTIAAGYLTDEYAALKAQYLAFV